MSITVLPKSATFEAASTSLIGERLALVDLKVANRQVVGRGSQHLRSPIVIAVDHLRSATHRGRGQSRGIAFADDRPGVVFRQRLRVPRAHTDARAGDTARKNHDQVAADGGDLLLIRSSAPDPTATIAITAATPMMMPSMVSAERILFTRSARNAILMAAAIFLPFIALPKCQSGECCWPVGKACPQSPPSAPSP